MQVLGLIRKSMENVSKFHILTICAPMIYVHNVLDACISITRGSGRGLGPGIREFFGPFERASSR